MNVIFKEGYIFKYSRKLIFVIGAGLLQYTFHWLKKPNTFNSVWLQPYKQTIHSPAESDVI